MNIDTNESENAGAGDQAPEQLQEKLLFDASLDAGEDEPSMGAGRQGKIKKKKKKKVKKTSSSVDRFEKEATEIEKVEDPILGNDKVL